MVYVPRRILQHDKQDHVVVSLSAQDQILAQEMRGRAFELALVSQGL